MSKAGKTWIDCKVWERDTYEITTREFDADLYHFDIIKNGQTVASIAPDNLDAMHDIIIDLDNGHDVDGWEDGQGGIIDVSSHVEATPGAVADLLHELKDAYEGASELVSGWLRDERIINGIAMNYNDLTQPADAYTTLKAYLQHEIETYLFDKE